ncbi:decarboxylating 6-phosphogluconate dehydrogenase [Modestobacter sp. VKM Ac-2986]|uniref:phosphogluconate dehydrogenase (NAD(+)-dependent, decarboxylating) n=1 Tax=Modestobacter sp. VKM Ac-2986 TaxID=3004140 RepID=UPI0022AAD039|nr:decarboxylating 6-phosphogluconate dehydrogenase [Modestobacter sp. VKM Ac-2986]MCZ2827382.1 decarboxylating 6-phosphogluconate dehydrogenase [Modestobacter sp. VKM Ac-2986]
MSPGPCGRRHRTRQRGGDSWTRRTTTEGPTAAHRGPAQTSSTRRTGVQLGMIGLGKMGGNMAERVRRAGIEVVGYDRAPGTRDVDSLQGLVDALQAPRVVWVMVPAGDPTRATVRELGELLSPGDVVVDGGNSKYTDDKVHADELAEKGIGYVDAGVSGGVWGLQNGYALMVGGTAEDVAKVQPVFDALKPPAEAAEGAPVNPGAGFVHAGPVGAGHFAKMVHNGIEYAMMQAYGEGYELLEKVDLIQDVPGVVASWTQGTVIRSWLLDLLVRALQEDPELERITGYAEDSGEGRWTVEAAIDNAVPMPAISASLFARFSSRQDDSPTMKAVAALRNQFGGHAVRSIDTGAAEKPA